MIVLFFLSLYLIIALASFDVHDPGWSSLGSGRSIHNLGGRAGAWSADVLMSLFGYLSYLFPLLIAYRAWLVFRDVDKQWSWLMAGLRFLGFAMTMVAAAAWVGSTQSWFGLAAVSSSGNRLVLELSLSASHR